MENALQRGLEMPRSRFKVISLVSLTLVTVLFLCFFVINLFNGNGMIPILASMFWLVLVGFGFWWVGKEPEGMSQFMAHFTGGFLGRRFMDCENDSEGQPSLQVGVEILGRSYLQTCISMEKIASVSWEVADQSKLDAWDVLVGYLEEGEMRYYSCHLNGDSEEARLFGLSIVSMLNRAGANLIKSADGHYVG